MLPDSRCLALEERLAAALTPVVSELRMTDLVVFVDHVVNGREAAVSEIVDAAAELHYAPGFIAYDGDADVCAHWNGAPSVALCVRLATASFAARVRLIVRADHAAIELQHIGTEGRSSIEDKAFFDALADNAVARRQVRTAPRDGRQISG